MGFFKNTFERSDQKTTPVIIDILAPDMETSLLPPDLKFLFYVNPKSIQFSYQKIIARTQTLGGHVEFHWGDGITEISLDNATGGFVRLYTGLSATTNETGQGRRQTLAYDQLMSFLALFHFNADIYDSKGNVAAKGFLKLIFEPGIYIGWFDGDVPLTHLSDSPFQINFSSRFKVHKEITRFRSPNLETDR